MDGIDARGYAWGVLPFTTMDGFVDASYAGDVDTRRSTTGNMFKISGGPVSWQNRLQSSVGLSSMEAKYMAASAVTQEAMWLNRLLQQLGFKTPRPTKIYEDNKAAILFSDHPGDHRRSKHIDTVLHGDIILEYIPTAEQLADGLTKPLTGAQHQVICLDNYLSKFKFQSA